MGFYPVINVFCPIINVFCPVCKFLFFKNVIIICVNCNKIKEDLNMKKIVMKYAYLLSSLALVFTTFASNRSCTAILYEEKLPETAKKLRKF